MALAMASFLRQTPVRCRILLCIFLTFQVTKEMGLKVSKTEHIHIHAVVLKLQEMGLNLDAGLS